MPHFAKPFFRPARNLWYVQLDGKQVNLGRDRSEAFKTYHALMSARAERAEFPPRSPTLSDGRPRLVVELVDQFLDFVQKHRAADTYRWYKDRLNLFCNAVPADLTAEWLRPFHVQQWIDSYAHLSLGSKRNHCRSVTRAMRWAEQQGYIECSPLAHFQKPPAGRKERVVTPVEYAKLLAHTPDQAFKDLLIVTWETGARPQETLRVEARRVDVPNARWVFPAREAKGGRLPRVVYLTPRALEVTHRLMREHPHGPLFRNTAGRAWTADATNCRFQRLKTHVNTRCSLYALRHTWMNRMLMSGVDALTVAVLAGHSDPGTLAKHYQHLSQSPAFLSEQARRASA